MTMTMANDDFLLPHLPSDDEDETEQQKTNERQEESDDDDDEYEIDDSFQFGGILGEDGGMMSSSSSFSSSALFAQSSTAAAGWSYQSALNRIEEQQNSRNSGNNGLTLLPRINVASLIAAKRKAFLQSSSTAAHQSAPPATKNKQQQEGTGDGSESSTTTSDDDSNSDDSDDSDDDDEPPRDDSHKGLEEDRIKTRIEAKNSSSKQKEKESKSSKDDDDVNNDSDNASESGGSHDADGDKDDNGNNGNQDEHEQEQEEDDDDKVEAAKAAAFFDSAADGSSSDNMRSLEKIEVFAQLTLSRPLLRGVASMGFVTPTPIQAAVIPLALQGRDICASAVTGSGKTAAFLLPILERLLHRHGGRTKCIILTPTRELAAQCVGMLESLAQFTKNIRACLIVGGSKDVNSQAAELRTRPEIVVATPGRLLDHVTNTPGFSLESVEFLVLDEADRLLDLGFTDEVHEIIKSCPGFQRQTLLFSATMNTNVDELVKLSLKRPVRIRIKDSNSSNNSKDMEVAPRLEQEFVRVRAGNEGINREGMLLALLSRTFTKQTIVFFDTKVTAHRLMILCGLVGIQCAELHGNLTQKQRLQALEDFRQGQVDVLLATDLAARGLDIDKVSAVINFEMPTQLDTYIHRIGRTARAGRGGQSCTLIGEGRRYLMKELIKDAEAKTKKRQEQQKKGGNEGVIRSRTIPAAVVSHFVQKIQSLEPHVEEVLQAEAVARMDRLAEMEVSRAQNIIEHADEIKARPAREWFIGNKQKETTKKATAAERKQMYEDSVGTGTHRMNRKKRRAREAMEALNAPEDDGDGGGGGGGDMNDNENRSHSVKTVTSVKSAARAHKKKVEDEAREYRKRTLHDQDVYHEQLAEKKKKHKKKAKSGKDALGDGSLFAEDEVFHAQKPDKRQQETKPAAAAAAAVAKSSYNFRGHDPDKKLGKKKGHKAFKSKSKHKRRK